MLRGKQTDKVAQHGHERLSTFGIGADLGEVPWRSVLRQLIALGHVRTEGDYNTLELTPSARDVLRGEVELLLRVASESAPRGQRQRAGSRSEPKPPPVPLDADATERFNRLKAWRSEVAREHNLPAYVVFHDAALAEMARAMPTDLHQLGSISGVGAKKLDAYGEQILRTLHGDEQTGTGDRPTGPTRLKAEG